MKNTPVLALTLAASSLCLFTTANAQSHSPDPLQVRSWAAGCAGCHGTDGRAEVGMVALAGMNKDEIVKRFNFLPLF